MIVENLKVSCLSLRDTFGLAGYNFVVQFTREGVSHTAQQWFPVTPVGEAMSSEMLSALRELADDIEQHLGSDNG